MHNNDAVYQIKLELLKLLIKCDNGIDELRMIFQRLIANCHTGISYSCPNTITTI